MTDRPAKLDVALVEDPAQVADPSQAVAGDAAGPPVIEGTEAAARGGAPSQRRWTRWWPLALVVVLALVYGGRAWSEATEQQRRIEALAGQEGYLPGHGPGSQLRWTYQRSGQDEIVVRGGTMVVGAWSLAGDPTGYTGIELRTGQEIWRHVPDRAVPEWCDLDPRHLELVYLVCRAYPDPPDPDVRRGSGTERLTVLDVATGDAVLERAGPASATAILGDTLVSLTVEVSDFRLVTTDLRTGEDAWLATLPFFPGVDAENAWVEVHPLGNKVLLASPGQSHLVSLDGTVLTSPDTPHRDDVEREMWWAPLSAAGEHWVAQYFDDGDSGGFRREVYDAHGRMLLSVRDFVVAPLATDRTGRDILLSPAGEGLELSVGDLSTGRVLFQIESPGPDEVVLLDGALVYRESADVVARDLRSGDVRWRADLVLPRVLGTDGRLVLVGHQESGSSNARLTALAIADGREEWTVDVGLDWGVLSTRGGHVFFERGTELSLIGPPEAS